MSSHSFPASRPVRPGERFTLVFRNGARLLHQDPIALAQFRSDGRLAAVWREPAGQVLNPPGEELR